MIQYMTSGESHGPSLTGIIKGIPAGIRLTGEYINSDLARRQKGYGRGGRMQIESDRARIVSGVRHGITLGSPISILIENKDWENWKENMKIEPGIPSEPVELPRPGHADLPGSIKYRTKDIRNILERASARETAMRVALGAVARRFLEEFDIRVGSHVISIGNVCINTRPHWSCIQELADKSPLRCVEKDTEELMIGYIKEVIQKGDTLGGVIEVFVTGVPVGLGSHTHWDEKMDALICRAVMSIQGIKGVEIGMGFEAANSMGSKVHDEIYYKDGKFMRNTNNAGGIEGGVTNGETIVIKAAMKPIPTLSRPLKSVNLQTKRMDEAAKERSDVCAVPACAIVCQAMTSLEIARAFKEKFGGDSIEEIKEYYRCYKKYVGEF